MGQVSLWAVICLVQATTAPSFWPATGWGPYLSQPSGFSTVASSAEGLPGPRWPVRVRPPGCAQRLPWGRCPTEAKPEAEPGPQRAEWEHVQGQSCTLVSALHCATPGAAALWPAGTASYEASLGLSVTVLGRLSAETVVSTQREKGRLQELLRCSGVERRGYAAASPPGARKGVPAQFLRY